MGTFAGVWLGWVNLTWQNEFTYVIYLFFLGGGEGEGGRIDNLTAAFVRFYIMAPLQLLQNQKYRNCCHSYLISNLMALIYTNYLKTTLQRLFKIFYFNLSIVKNYAIMWNDSLLQLPNCQNLDEKYIY